LYFTHAREAASPLFFFANPVAANAGAARSYGVVAEIAGCCARAATGHAMAAPPRAAINSRRLIVEIFE